MIGHDDHGRFHNQNPLKILRKSLRWSAFLQMFAGIARTLRESKPKKPVAMVSTSWTSDFNPHCFDYMFCPGMPQTIGNVCLMAPHWCLPAIRTLNQLNGPLGSDPLNSGSYWPSYHSLQFNVPFGRNILCKWVVTSLAKDFLHVNSFSRDLTALQHFAILPFVANAAIHKHRLIKSEASHHDENARLDGILKGYSFWEANAATLFKLMLSFNRSVTQVFRILPSGTCGSWTAQECPRQIRPTCTHQVPCCRYSCHKRTCSYRDPIRTL